MGAAKAPVTIIEYSDFQCPFCSRAATTMAQIMTNPKYKNKVRLVFKQMPLSFHKNAQKAAEAALFAHKYNKFWEMHDLLFDNQSELSEEDLLNYATAIGLSRSRLELALESGEFAEAVSKDAKEASSMGLSGTPTFIINGKLVAGAQPLEKFESAIDEALQNSKNKKNKKKSGKK